MADIFKAEFIKKYRKILGEETENFLKASSTSLLPSFRVNTLKIRRRRLRERLENKGYKLREIPWYRKGYIVYKPEVGLGKTLEHSLGYFYLQDSASMIPPLVLNPIEHQKVLDLCAAPGSKTTQIAQMMRNTGMIVANDPQKHRLKPLCSNLQRCGVANTLVTSMDGRDFSGKTKEKFDRVLVDVPCSGSGGIRKRRGIAREWSSQFIKGLSDLQKKLLISGFECLKQGGTLVYSTCSLDPEEDEGVIDYLLRMKNGCKVEKVRVPHLQIREGLREWNGVKYQEGVKNGVRIYPQDNDTIGFFFCKVKKDES
ncbi:MAG: NOL1/NOP2/sun family putative RNA methylase [Thermoproteota archaeon]